MASYLVVISGSDRGKEQQIPEEGRCTVGRSEGVDLRLGDSQVSRRHFTIAEVAGAWWLTDLDSSAGTFVNGEQVQSCALIPDDRIRVGSTDLAFATDESRSDDASSANLALSQDLQDLERAVGRTFQGYDIDGILAAGSRSVVFRARQQKNGRLTALKILKTNFAQSEADVQRFVRGINAAKEARNPCLVRLHAAGRKGRNCWVAMEFVKGETLAEFIAREGAEGCLTPEQAIRLGIDMAQGLESIRERKFLHRNVTPENILYDTEHGGFKLNGLMWAKALEGKWSESITAAGEVLGDIRYYAPEQLGSGEQMDGRVDLYSLGATLYTVLTGHAPFRVESLPLLSQVAAICSQVPERLIALRPDIPADLDVAVMKLLARRPDDRYQTPAELLADLQRVAGIDVTIDRQSIRSTESGVPLEAAFDIPGPFHPAIAVMPAVVTAKRRKPSRFLWLAPGAVMLLISLIFVVVSRSGSRPKHRVVDARERIDSRYAVNASPGSSRPKAENMTDGTAPPRDVDSVGMESNDDPAADPWVKLFGSVNEPSAKPKAPLMKNDSPPESEERADQRTQIESKSMAKLSPPVIAPGDSGSAGTGKTEQQSPVASSVAALVAFINEQIRQGWTDGNVQPSPRSDDAEWLRRIHLDLIGRIPGVDVVEKFLADKDASKRARMIDQLLDSQDYVHYWSIVWTNLSVGRRPGERASRAAMLRYFRKAFNENRAWSDIVVELVSAEGHSEENGAVNFVLAEIPGAANEAAEITAKTTRLLMGVQAQCTQCHNHPFNDRQQRQFWEFNTFFRGTDRINHMRFDAQSGLDVVDYAELINNPVNGPVYFERRNGLMEAAYPAYFGEAIEPQPDSNRRGELARRMVAGQRPLIAVAMANRMWGHLFGYGFTRPIDDMGPHNPPLHPELLDRLAAEFVSSGYDLKQLIRWIVNCDAYHLASRRVSENDNDNPVVGSLPLFSHYYLKSLSPESLCESLLVATSAGDAGWEQLARDRQRLMDQFLEEYVAGGNDDATTYNGSIPQSLTLMNGDLTRMGISAEAGRFIPLLLARHKTDAERIRKLYLTILGREPDRAEATLIGQHLRRQKDHSLVYQNVCWALLNSNEFSINH